MIYLLTNKNKKTLLVKFVNDLPTDHNQNIQYIDNNLQYVINDEVFANISILPNNQEGTEQEFDIIAQNYFGDYTVKKFNSTNFFSAYLIYTMSN